MSDLSKVSTEDLLKMLGGHAEPQRQLAQQPAPNSNSRPWDQVLPRAAGLAQSFAKGATFDQGNKLDAALGLGDATKMAPMTGSYQERLDSLKARDAAIPSDVRATGETLGVIASPVNKLFGGIADSLMPTVGKGLSGLAQRYGNYGLQGGLMNTLYQATLGDKDKAKQSAEATGALGGAGMVAPEGGVGETLLTGAKNFGKGAAAGIAIPGALEGGSEVMKSIFRPILSRLNPEEAAIAGIGRSLDRQNLTPEMFESKLDKLGPAGMPANVGGQVTDYARDIAQFPGQARSNAQSAFAAQAGGKMATQGGAIGRVEGAINHTLSDETAAATTDALVDLRTKTSSPIWRTMFQEARAPQSDVLDVLATNPEVQRGMKIGQSIARNDVNSAGAALDPTKFRIGNKPTFQAWHAAKEGLDDILFSGGENIVNPTTGQLTKYGGSINGMRKSILEELKLNFPEYEDALNTWSGPTQAMRMIELGQKAARGDTRLTHELMQDLTDNEKDFFRIGLADQAKYLVSKTKDGANVVKSVFGDQNQRRNIEQAFETRKDFNEFRKLLAAEDKFSTSKGAILGGSPTATRTLGAADAAQDIGKVVLEGAKNGGTTGAAAGVMQKGWNYMKAEPEAVRDAAGKMLFTTDLAAKAKLINELKAQNAKGSIFGSPGMSWLPRYGAVGAAKF